MSLTLQVQFYVQRNQRANLPKEFKLDIYGGHQCRLNHFIPQFQFMMNTYLTVTSKNE